MLIHIINGTYGHRPILPDGKRSEHVVPSTRRDPPIDVDEKEAQRLVKAKVAEYVQKEAVATDAAPPEPEAPNGTMPSGEGDESGPGDGGNESDDLTDDEDVIVYTTDMKADELRAAMRERGLPIRVGMTKAEMVEVLNGGGEEPPNVEPEDVVEG